MFVFSNKYLLTKRDKSGKFPTVMIEVLRHNSLFPVLVIIVSGYFIGQIRVRAFNFDTTAIILIAMILGHWGFQVSPVLKTLGLILFLYMIGLQAGPGFFNSFRREGLQMNLLALIIVGTGALLTLLFAHILHIHSPLAVGIFAGALTSTPGLAAATEVSGDPTASLGYGVAYPVGVIITIMTLRLIQKLMPKQILAGESDYQGQLFAQNPPLKAMYIRITNSNMDGMKLADTDLEKMLEVKISRIRHTDSDQIPTPDIRLAVGDIIRVVGTESAVEKAQMILGEFTEQSIPRPKNTVIRPIVVFNKDYLGKTLGEVQLLENYNVIITRVRRSGIDLSAIPNRILRLGDKLMVIGEPETLDQLADKLGTQLKNLVENDIIPVMTGMILGLILGAIPFYLSPNISFTLGVSGGIIITALILGSLGKTGPMTWVISGHSTQLLKNFGMLLFLASVGVEAGTGLIETISTNGIQLLAAAVLITFITMAIALFVAIKVFKMNMLVALGAITGGMTNTPGLAVLNKMSDSDAINTAYAAVYPFALVLMIIFSHLLVSF